jgi:uncharacterized Zn finger protein
MEKISKRTERKGYWIFKDGKVKKDIETDRRIHFLVKGKKDHFVIFDKIKNEFSCDCEFYSLHLKSCSHIIASQMYLNEQKDK